MRRSLALSMCLALALALAGCEAGPSAQGSDARVAEMELDDVAQTGHGLIFEFRAGSVERSAELVEHDGLVELTVRRPGGLGTLRLTATPAGGLRVEAGAAPGPAPVRWAAAATAQAFERDPFSWAILDPTLLRRLAARSHGAEAESLWSLAEHTEANGGAATPASDGSLCVTRPGAQTLVCVHGLDQNR